MTDLYFGPCPFCGSYHTHTGMCHRIKAVHYYPDGTMKSVELHEPDASIVGPFAGKQMREADKS